MLRSLFFEKKVRMMKSKQLLNPYIIVGIGVLAVSTSAIFVKLTSAPSGVTAFYRMFFTVLMMLPVFLFKYISEIKHISKRDWLLCTCAGIFLSFHFILWFESLNYTSVASSTVLVTLQPLFAFIGGFLFFKERYSIVAIISALIAIAGSFIIGWGDFQYSGFALFGDLLALFACALITGYLMFGQAVRKRVSSVTYTFAVYGISSVVLFIYVLLVNEPFLDYSAKDWTCFIMLALIPNLFGHSLFNWSLKWVSTTVISMAILFEPVGASIMAYFILDEKLMPAQIFGGLIVIGGLLLFTVSNKFPSRQKSTCHCER